MISEVRVLSSSDVFAFSTECQLFRFIFWCHNDKVFVRQICSPQVWHLVINISYKYLIILVGHLHAFLRQRRDLRQQTHARSFMPELFHKVSKGCAFSFYYLFVCLIVLIQSFKKPLNILILLYICFSFHFMTPPPNPTSWPSKGR